MNKNLIVRAGVAVVAAACLMGALAGCAGGAADAAPSAEEAAVDATWTFAQDEELPLLAEEGSSTVMPSDGWCAVEEGIQLQLTGGSIPGVNIASVEQEGTTLTVALEVNDGPSTMDLVMSEWMLTPDVAGQQIERVLVDYGHGDEPVEVPVLVQQ